MKIYKYIECGGWWIGCMVNWCWKCGDAL